MTEQRKFTEQDRKNFLRFAYDLGRSEMDKGLGGNPYKKGSDSYWAWHAGRDAAIKATRR